MWSRTPTPHLSPAAVARLAATVVRDGELRTAEEPALATDLRTAARRLARRTGPH
jgi:hypothetical protein